MNEVNIQLWKQANQIYAQLMDLTVSDALSQLSQMQEVDDELKSVVLTLISSGDLSSQYFNKQVGSNFRIPGINAIEYNLGDVIADYQLQELLGSGGMAKVYQAKKVGADSQKSVAIKLFNHTGYSTVLQSRFAIEQEILSGLSHPHIVNMHHGGTSQEGVPYIVMDLIEQAQDIDDYVLSHQSSIRQIVYWILSAAKAIAYAHNNLIVHRDIKPSNLLIDASGRLQVVDFGIAKLMTREDAPQKTTIMALTPTFAAPEQINSGQISVTTDVFSLAAVCLALIIKELPLPADRLLKSCTGDETHIWQVLRAKVKDKDLRNILNHALQQNPLKRYRNMDLLVDDLSAWLANKPVLATPDSWLYRIKKFAKRRSALFAALSTLIIMALLAIALLGWQVEKTRAEAKKANEVKDFMLNVFSVVNPDEALGEKILAKDLLSQAFAEIQAKSFADQDTQVELMTAMGQSQLQLGLNNSADESFVAALKLKPDSIEAMIGHVKIILATGNFAKAIDKLTELTKRIDKDDPLNAELLLLQAQINITFTKDYESAGQFIQQAQTMFLENDNIRGYLAGARHKANIMYLQSQPEAAAQYLEQQLGIALMQLSPINTTVLAIKTDLVDMYNDYGDFPQAIKHSTQLIQDITDVLGDEHPFLIQAYLSQAGTQRATGEIAGAQENANQALLLSRKINGEQHESTARAINFIAILHYVGGEIELAIEKMQQASDIFVALRGDDHAETWEAKTNLTALLNQSGRYDEAISTLAPVYQKQIDVLGPTHKSTIYSQTVMVKLYVALDRLDEAQVLGEDMLKVALSELGMGHPLTLGGHFSLAQVYQKQGKFAEAIELLNTIINSESWDENNEQAINAYNALGDVYLANSDVANATEYKEKSLAVAMAILSKDSPRTWSQMLNNYEFYLKTKDKAQAAIYRSQLESILAHNETVSPAVKDRFEQLQQQHEATY